MKKWSILDDLHAEFLRNPPTKNRQRATLERYKHARANRAAAEKALEKAITLEGSAAAAVVATHGRGPVSIDAVEYIPSYAAKNNRVFFIVRDQPKGVSDE